MGNGEYRGPVPVRYLPPGMTGDDLIAQKRAREKEFKDRRGSWQRGTKAERRHSEALAQTQQCAGPCNEWLPRAFFALIQRREGGWCRSCARAHEGDRMRRR